jgi:hypothetical protein
VIGAFSSYRHIKFVTFSVSTNKSVTLGDFLSNEADTGSKSGTMIVPPPEYPSGKCDDDHLGERDGRVHGIGEGVSERKGKMAVYMTDGREDGKGCAKRDVQV